MVNGIMYSGTTKDKDNHMTPAMSMPPIVTDKEGMRICALAGCGTRFLPPTVRTRFCENHRGKEITGHAARNRMIAESYKKICNVCGDSFTATDKRQERCQACLTVDVVLSGSARGELRVNSRKVTAGGRVSGSDVPTMPTFIAVDGEGIGRGSKHKYVLLGVGDVQKQWPDGVTDITEIFSFLYDQFEDYPGATFVGFFLAYDFNMWLKLLPRDRARMLLTRAGRASRARRGDSSHQGPFPVEFRGWQFDILGKKRFKLRPKPCSCQSTACEHVKGVKWMFICDTGPYFESSLLSAIDPAQWHDPVVSDAEYELVKRGKERRDSATLDDDMRAYNRLENNILARLMSRYADGLARARVTLAPQQWFGPGQAAQYWMRVIGTLDKTTEAVRGLDKRKLGKVTFREHDTVKPAETYYDAMTASYYGGWFELTVHGIVPGSSYEYDLNSAYPWVMARLPCMCGTWTQGTGTPRGTLSHRWISVDAQKAADRTLRLCHVMVQGKDERLGPLPYRDKNGGVHRPRSVLGWYWQHEIDMARVAGLADKVTYYEWLEYAPCDHKPPLAQLSELYENRLSIGKNTSAGKAFKKVYNSAYGKLAQSEDGSVFGNPVYASLITSVCRTRILEAIATHPGKSDAVAMVATDGIYFTTSHTVIDAEIDAYLASYPDASEDERLGYWSRAVKTNLTLFKPGVYWDDAAREAIALGEAPRFKARGISARAFAHSVSEVDDTFRSWGTLPPQRDKWPAVTFTSGFAQTSVLQALEWSEGAKTDSEKNARYHRDAGRIKEQQELTQDSNPVHKRDTYHMEYDPDRGIFRSGVRLGHATSSESTPYQKRFGLDSEEPDIDDIWQDDVSPDGPVTLGFRQALGVG